MQIRAEEQDEEDKYNICLMGQKVQPNNADIPINNPSNDSKVPQSKSTIQRNINGKVESNIKGQYADFPQPVGSLPKIKRDDIPQSPDVFFDAGAMISKEDQQIKDSMPKTRGNMTLDPYCLSCTSM